MVSRKAFIDKANQEGFSFNIQIPWWRYTNFKSLVWRKRLSGGATLSDLSFTL